MPDKEFTTVTEDGIGLDRSSINKHDQIQLLQQHPKNSLIVASPQNEDEDRSKIQHIRQKRHDVASKLRGKLHISSSKDVEGASLDSILTSVTKEMSESRLGKAAPSLDKTTTKDALHNPIDAVKSKVLGQGNHQIASNIAAKEIPHGKDVDLVKAKAAVDHAQTDRKKALAVKTMEELIAERQNMFVRWTLDRHVTKVRILPQDTFVRKPRTTFQTLNTHGDVVIDWSAYSHHLLVHFAHQYGGQYIGYGSNPPPPSKESIIPNVERLIVASAPFQEFIMTTRRVYRWENHAETSKYLIIYLVLWGFNLLLPGVLSAIVYFVVLRHIHEPTLKDLRQDVMRTEDLHQTALTLTEFIEKKGDELWADELLEGLGPWLMIQLCDVAAFFEVIRNFYEWRKPSRTLVTLAVFVIAIFVTSFTPVWLLVKSATLGAGFTFFGLFPIATNVPEYRLLASPAKRIFWNIPTHGQWAIKSIQAEGSRYKEAHSAQSLSSLPTTQPKAMPLNDALSNIISPISEEAYGTYNAHDSGTKGYLVIGPSSIRFVSIHLHSTHSDTIHWSLPYSQIQNLEKVNRIVAQNIPTPHTDSGNHLKFVSKSGKERLLEKLDQRDQAFSQILGFSDATWQVVW